ncbi:MAG TPA: hypothetical protein VGC79_07275, partial [Polyangiaceae bacterium]
MRKPADLSAFALAIARATRHPPGTLLNRHCPRLAIALAAATLAALAVPAPAHATLRKAKRAPFELN